jgi:hypothetical protein
VTCFAVATVPEGANILAAWHEFIDKGILSLSVNIDLNCHYHCESFHENGVCELWIPVKIQPGELLIDGNRQLQPTGIRH